MLFTNAKAYDSPKHSSHGKKLVKVGVVFGRVGGAERATATRRAPAMLGRVRVVLPIYIRYIPGEAHALPHKTCGL